MRLVSGCAGLDQVEGLHGGVSAEGRESIKEVRGGLVWPDRGGASQQDIPCVQSEHHPLNRDPGLIVPGRDRALDGGSAAPARQKGSVDVEGAVGAELKDVGAKDLPVAGDHERVRAEGGQRGDELRVLGGGRLKDREARLIGEGGQLGPRNTAPPTAGAIGGRDEAKDLVSAREELTQDRGREGRRSQEGDAHGGRIRGNKRPRPIRRAGPRGP